MICRRLRLPPRLLPRLALGEGGHQQLPTDQEGLSRGILDVFCSCPMVRLVPQWANAATIGQTALERLGTPPPRLALRGVPFFGVE